MKVELHEDCVTLIAENNWEVEALAQIHRKGVHKLRYTNEWEQTGGLRFEWRSEADHWGHR